MMNAYSVGNTALFCSLALLSCTTETFGHLISVPSSSGGNSVKGNPDDASTLVFTTQQDNEVRAENDHGVHSKERSSEEDEEEGKGDVVDPNDSNLREEMYITIHIYLQLLTDTVDRRGETRKLSAVQLHDPSDSQEPQNIAVSVIHNSFINRKTFSCPKIKNDFVTGTNTGDLSPEDIGIIAAMGDSLATGKGLWPQKDIEFRGAAFPIGGDATIDGLVTIANILHEFNDKLVGVSHGMGTKFQLPYHQLNVAESDATSSSLPSQAKELVQRLNTLREVDINNEWTMVIVTIGTEEICTDCKAPDYDALLKSLLILNGGIQNALVVLLGPIHVSSSNNKEGNLLRSRCNCTKNKSDEFMKELSREWTKAFVRLQTHFEQPYIKLYIQRQKFDLLALPMLTITSRYPSSLLLANLPLLNRKGHTYAAKWLWNRLMTGPTYNLSLAVLSQDSYYCPSMGCPYFRTPANRHYCRLLRHVDVENQNEESASGIGRTIRRSRQKLYATAGTVVLICFLTVLLTGTILYQKSKYGKRIRIYENKRGASKSLIIKD